MRRRGNKSSKVPNVKLRPANPTSVRQSQSTWWAQDTQADPGLDGTCLDLCPRPFKGIVFCATGAIDKPTLFKQAIELGATSVNAFTDQVTHLIAIDHGGAKYTCALERKIPILQPSWITESYQIWLKGDDVDLAQSVKRHHLPIFSGVVLSLSGIDDIVRRTQINKLVTQQQGVYVKNLERPVKVTHLLCSGNEETDKMRYAEKFNNRGEANIHIIWEEWFWDSLEFGGRFGEEMYRVDNPRPERKSIVGPPTSPPPSSSALPSEASSPPAAPKPYLHPNPHPSQDGGEDEDELATIKRRVPAMTLHLWESLLKPRGFEINAGKLVRSPSKKPYPQPQDAGPSRGPSPAREVGGSILSSFRRANSFVEPVERNTTMVTGRPFRRTSTVANLPSLQTRGGRMSSSSFTAQTATRNEGGSSANGGSLLFAGLKFRALGEAKSANVRMAIDGCGGKMVSEGEGDEVDFIVVRLVSGSKFYRDEPDEAERIKYRTECWLERCIFEERICPPDDHVTFTPLKTKTPVQGADQVNLSFSGLDQSEACWMRRLIRALGIGLAPNFSRRSTHLLCPSRTGTKFEKAHEWGVPVVDMGWLKEMAATDIVPPVAGYLVRGTTIATGAEAGDEKGWGLRAVVGRAADIETKSISKGKMKEKQGAIDITRDNSPAENSPQSSPRAVRNPQLDQPHQPTSPPRAERETAVAPGLSRRPTLDAIERDRQVTRVPSSKSPSPMKLPASGSSARGSRGRVASSLPVRVPNEVAKALQESIASLLGKRQSSDEETVVRAGKRPRPRPRPKGKARSPEKCGGAVNDSELLIAPPPPDQYIGSPGPFDEMLGEEPVEGAMRVIYEDPGQREEKRRLMSLFEGQAGGRDALGSAEKGRGLVRRSTRIAGF